MRERHPPSTDPADILRFDGFQFNQVGMTVVAEQAITIAQYRLSALASAVSRSPY
jgi:hypothetical protein